MKNTRRKHSDAFKTEVALEAIRERKTLSELAQEYQLAHAQISTWKAEFLSNAQMAFCSTPQFLDHWLSLFPPTLSVPYENKKDERERLFAKIGRLEMELDW